MFGADDRHGAHTLCARTALNIAGHSLQAASLSLLAWLVSSRCLSSAVSSVLAVAGDKAQRFLAFATCESLTFSGDTLRVQSSLKCLESYTLGYALRLLGVYGPTSKVSSSRSVLMTACLRLTSQRCSVTG